MARMRFDLDNVKDCLVEHGKVFTVRSYWLVNQDVHVEGVGMCRRIRGFEVHSKEDLKRFVKFSGFESVNDWWEAIGSFIGRKRKFMYIVKLI
jgi:hypothetical protein